MAQAKSDVEFKVAEEFYSKGLQFERKEQWIEAEGAFLNAVGAARKIIDLDPKKKFRLAQYLYHLALTYQHQGKKTQQLQTVNEASEVLKSIQDQIDKDPSSGAVTDPEIFGIILFHKLAAKMHQEAEQPNDAIRFYQLALSDYLKLKNISIEIEYLPDIYKSLAALHRFLPEGQQSLKFRLYDMGRIIYSKSAPAHYNFLETFCNFDDAVIAHQPKVDREFLHQYCNFMSLLLTVIEHKKISNKQLQNAIIKTYAHSTVQDIFSNWICNLGDSATMTNPVSYMADAAARLSTAEASLQAVEAHKQQVPTFLTPATLDDNTFLLRRITRSMNAEKRTFPVSPPLTEPTQSPVKKARK